MGHVSDDSTDEDQSEESGEDEPVVGHQAEGELRARLDELVEGFLQTYAEKIRAEVANAPAGSLQSAIATWEGLSSAVQVYDIHGTQQEKLELVASVAGPESFQAENVPQ
jgi:hypothetical protein